VTVVVALTAYNGVVEGINATHYADTFGMKVATATQLAYGAFAVLALVAMAFRRRLVPRLLIPWGAAVVATGALAPVVYAGTSMAVGLLVGAITAIVVGLAIWAWPRTGP